MSFEARTQAETLFVAESLLGFKARLVIFLTRFKLPATHSQFCFVFSVDCSTFVCSFCIVLNINFI